MSAQGAAELLLWRHGQTDYNLGGRVQGRVDIPLNAEGEEQARRAALVLAAAEPTRIVSSPLVRARRTAEELSRLTGLEVAEDAELAERSFGAWEGLTRAEIKAGWGEQYRIWRAGGDPEGVDVEPRLRAARRVARALERAAAPGDRVVVVAHGSALTLGTTHLLGLDAGAWLGLRGMDNCRWARLRTADREPGWVLEGWNLGG